MLGYVSDHHVPSRPSDPFTPDVLGGEFPGQALEQPFDGGKRLEDLRVPVRVRAAPGHDVRPVRTVASGRPNERVCPGHGVTDGLAQGDGFPPGHAHLSIADTDRDLVAVSSRRYRPHVDREEPDQELLRSVSSPSDSPLRYLVLSA